METHWQFIGIQITGKNTKTVFIDAKGRSEEEAMNVCEKSGAHPLIPLGSVKKHNYPIISIEKLDPLQSEKFEAKFLAISEEILGNIIEAHGGKKLDKTETAEKKTHRKADFLINGKLWELKEAWENPLNRPNIQEKITDLYENTYKNLYGMNIEVSHNTLPKEKRDQLTKILIGHLENALHKASRQLRERSEVDGTKIGGAIVLTNPSLFFSNHEELEKEINSIQKRRTGLPTIILCQTWAAQNGFDSQSGNKFHIIGERSEEKTMLNLINEALDFVIAPQNWINPADPPNPNKPTINNVETIYWSKRGALFWSNPNLPRNRAQIAHMLKQMGLAKNQDP